MNAVAQVTNSTVSSLNAFANSPYMQFHRTVGWTAAPLLAYHGYKRNSSIGWALIWGLLGGAVWEFAGAIALAQGFAKPAKGR